MSDYLVCAGPKVLLPGNDNPTPASIIVDKSSGKILEVRQGQHTTPQDLGLTGCSVEWIDAGNNTVLPGLVDAHVHLNEPGRTPWEGFWTGTRAAASGGVTTLVDMPLNSLPPTTTVSNLEAKRRAAEGQCHVDVAFWGGVIPGNQAHLKPLVKAGVRGFKCFLMESGVEEFPFVKKPDLLLSMKELEDECTVLLFHAELEDHSPETKSDPRHYSTFLASRPQKMETNAIALVVELQKAFPALKTHIVHLSAASALPVIEDAKAAGLPITVETCFHYLCLAAEDIPDGHAEFKCCPPVREGMNTDRLWDALKDGTIDCVVSDHSPCIPELKMLNDGDIMAAWGGISTLGLGLSLLWTEGKRRGVTLGQVVHWMSKKSAELAGFGNTKGQLQVGYDADFVLWDQEEEYEVTKDNLRYKNKISPYEGRKLCGVVQQTFLRGQKVFDRVGSFSGLPPVGKLL